MDHSFNEDARCLYCDCRPWGKWASLPCGAVFDPTHPMHERNDVQSFMAGYIAYTSAMEV